MRLQGVVSLLFHVWCAITQGHVDTIRKPCLTKAGLQMRCPVPFAAAAATDGETLLRLSLLARLMQFGSVCTLHKFAQRLFPCFANHLYIQRCQRCTWEIPQGEQGEFVNMRALQYTYVLPFETASLRKVSLLPWRLTRHVGPPAVLHLILGAPATNGREGHQPSPGHVPGLSVLCTCGRGLHPAQGRPCE